MRVFESVFKFWGEFLKLLIDKAFGALPVLLIGCVLIIALPIALPASPFIVYYFIRARRYEHFETLKKIEKGFKRKEKKLNVPSPGDILSGLINKDKDA